MKVNVTFTDLSLTDAAIILAFVKEGEFQMASEPHGPQPLPKRKRRTKAEMAAGKTAGERIDDARGPDGAEGDTAGAKAEGDAAEAQEPVEAVVATPGVDKPARHRTRKVSADAGAADAASDAGSDDGPSGKAPPRRRRRGTDGDAAVGGGSDKPRGRRASAQVSPDAGTGDGTESAPSRRRGKRKDAKVSEDIGGGEISDQDLMKAASEAADQLTPAAVMEILEEFAVSQVAELDQTQRPEFLGRLADELAAEGVPY